MSDYEENLRVKRAVQDAQEILKSVAAYVATNPPFDDREEMERLILTLDRKEEMTLLAKHLLAALTPVEPDLHKWVDWFKSSGEVPVFNVPSRPRGPVPTNHSQSMKRLGLSVAKLQQTELDLLADIEAAEKNVTRLRGELAALRAVISRESQYVSASLVHLIFTEIARQQPASSVMGAMLPLYQAIAAQKDEKDLLQLMYDRRTDKNFAADFVAAFRPVYEKYAALQNAATPTVSSLDLDLVGEEITMEEFAGEVPTDDD